MPFQNQYVSEGDLDSLDYRQFDSVRLASMSRELGPELWQRYRLRERVGGDKSNGPKLWQRLLVCVEMPTDVSTAARVLASLKIPNGSAFLASRPHVRRDPADVET